MKPRAIAGAFSLVLAAGLFVAGCSSLPSSSNVTAPGASDPAVVDTTAAPAPAPTYPPKPVDPEPLQEPIDPEKGRVKTPEPGKSEHPMK